MKIIYLGHSSFAVDTGAHLLIFDYPAAGCVPAMPVEQVRQLAAGHDSIVFASHSHADHYGQEIFTIPGARFVLSDDIAPRDGALMVRPDRAICERDFLLQTFRSTDEGVAFVVEIDGLRIYHAGDLNWWHWEGAPDPWNPDMARQFRLQVACLPSQPIDGLSCRWIPGWRRRLCGAWTTPCGISTSTAPSPCIFGGRQRCWTGCWRTR